MNQNTHGTSLTDEIKHELRKLQGVVDIYNIKSSNKLKDCEGLVVVDFITRNAWRVSNKILQPIDLKND